VNSLNKEKSGAIILIRGAGEIASGIAYRLQENHYRVCLTEIPYPLAVSRGTAFSDAVFDGTKTIGEITSVLAPLSAREINRAWEKGNIAIVIDPDGIIRGQMLPDVVIDARMLKNKTETKITDAKLVIGIGPGFYAGKDVHILVESNDRQGNLGKLIYEGAGEVNTGKPIDIGGLSNERVVWAPEDGFFTSELEIGDPVITGSVIAKVDSTQLKAPISGNLRGLLRSGVAVTKGTKLIEVDAVNDVKTFLEIREKMWLIGGVVVDAINKTKILIT